MFKGSNTLAGKVGLYLQALKQFWPDARPHATNWTPGTELSHMVHSSNKPTEIQQ